MSRINSTYSNFVSQTINYKKQQPCIYKAAYRKTTFEPVKQEVIKLKLSPLTPVYYTPSTTSQCLTSLYADLFSNQLQAKNTLPAAELQRQSILSNNTIKSNVKKQVYFSNTVQVEVIDSYCNKNNKDQFFYKISRKERKEIKKHDHQEKHYRTSEVRQIYKRYGDKAGEDIRLEILTLKNTSKNSLQKPILPSMQQFFCMG